MAYDGLLSVNNPLNNPGGFTPDSINDWATQQTSTGNNGGNNGGGGGGSNNGLGVAGSAWGLGLDTLKAGFGLYAGLKQLSMANKEFKFNKALQTQNMNNEVQQYNTNLQTTAGLRSSMEGTGGPNSQAANSFYNDNKLKGI